MAITAYERAKFRRLIINYYKRHGRDLAWRRTRNPYRILISEVMLQQTQVERVVVFYPKFIERFPDFRALASSSLSEVLAVWSGMGYNRRVVALIRAAQIVCRVYGGKLPDDPAFLVLLPGIGSATAGAIAAFAYGKPVPFIETNIRRVFIHHFFPRARRVDDKKILMLIAATIDDKNPREWYYALMDYGAYLARPARGAVSRGARLPLNPNQRAKNYHRQSRFEGSPRQLRGCVIRILLDQGGSTKKNLAKIGKVSVSRMQSILNNLVRDGLVMQSKNHFMLQ